jgi:hypothetical protein
MVVCSRLGWAFVRRLLRGRAGHAEMPHRAAKEGVPKGGQGGGQGSAPPTGAGEGAGALRAGLTAVVTCSSQARLGLPSMPTRMRIDLRRAEPSTELPAASLRGSRFGAVAVSDRSSRPEGASMPEAKAPAGEGANAQAGEGAHRGYREHGGQGAATRGEGACLPTAAPLNPSTAADGGVEPRQHRPVPAAFAAAFGQLRRAGRGRFEA